MKINILPALLLLFLNHSLLKARETPPGIPADNELLKMGYLDVTLYGADSTGKTVSTAAIRKAIDEAQSYQLACYFPSGTYLVDDMLNCALKVHLSPDWQEGDPFHLKYVSEVNYPIYLVGAAHPRPVIKLVQNAAGFNDPSSPMPVFWLWAQNRGDQHPELAGSTNPLHEQSNIAFNMVIRNFIIDLSGNKGAEGLRFAGAQGSTVEDITVLADGAFSGFHSSVGQGGGMYNIEVIGGQHGIVIDSGSQSKFPIIAGAVFKNQQKEVFRLDELQTPMLVVGFYIEKDSGNINTGWPNDGLSLVDGIIKYTGSSAKNKVLMGEDKSLYMKNVYVNTKGSLLSDKPAASVLSFKDWNHIEEFISTGSDGKQLVNGTESRNVCQLQVKGSSNPPSDLFFRKKHCWDPMEIMHIGMRNDPDFINIEDPKAFKAEGAPEPANGNDKIDDTRSIQWAIDHYEKVFIPKGTFLINEPLLLKSNSQILGAGKTYSILLANDLWNENKDHVMLRTPADPDAINIIAFFNLMINKKVHHDMARIEWRAGKNSIIKDIRVNSKHAPVSDHKLFQTLKIIGPTSGGRIYHWTCHSDGRISSNPDFRDILVEESEQGLSFYGVNAERSDGDVRFEVRNSRNLNIYYYVIESDSPNSRGGTIHPATPVRFGNSENIFHTCTAGEFQAQKECPVVEVDNCRNIRIANIKSFFDENRNHKYWYLISEKQANGCSNLVADEGMQLTYFRRD